MKTKALPNQPLDVIAMYCPLFNPFGYNNPQAGMPQGVGQQKSLKVIVAAASAETKNG